MFSTALSHFGREMKCLLVLYNHSYIFFLQICSSKFSCGDLRTRTLCLAMFKCVWGGGGGGGGEAGGVALRKTS